MSSEADRALGKSQGGNNSQGPIYNVPVSVLSLQLPSLLSVACVMLRWLLQAQLCLWTS